MGRLWTHASSCCALFWMNATMTKSTEFPRDNIWAKVITVLKIRFLEPRLISALSSSAARPATAAQHDNAMLTTAFLWTCMVPRKHRNTSSLWSYMMLITPTIYLCSIQHRDVRYISAKRLTREYDYCLATLSLSCLV